MEIRVLVFASLREAAGSASLELHLPPGSRAGAVVRALSERLPSRGALLARSALAINEEYAEADSLLHDGDTVAVIPPVSGGAGGIANAFSRKGSDDVSDHRRTA
jgi:molybdopterin converting factor subunit 1